MEYLKLLPGDKVIIGKHPVKNSHWLPDRMDMYIGHTTAIKERSHAGGDFPAPSYYIALKLDPDHGHYYYRMGDLTILPNMRNINNPYFWAKKLNKLPEGMY
jgi:hypothetical protein